MDWLSVPVITSSHTWENGKNEMSHQDPTLSEAWLGEMSDVAPVLFPFDAATAVATMAQLYQQRGRVAVVVAPKGSVPVVTTQVQALAAVRDGAIILSHDKQAVIQLLALGAYQLTEVQRAATCLRNKGIACSVVAVLEPGRFRLPRDEREAAYVHAAEAIAGIIPPVQKRLVVSHTRTDVMTGVLRPLDTGAADTCFMGYRNRGGTLDVFGMLYANQQTWAHIVQQCALLLDVDADTLLGPGLREALAGAGNPDILR